MKLTKEQIQAAQQLPVPGVACFKEPGDEVRFDKPPGAIGVSHGTLVLHHQMARGHFLSGFLLSLPVIRWFAPKCAARISEGQHVSPKEGQHVSLKEALGDPRRTKPRWHRGQHFWRNPN